MLRRQPARRCKNKRTIQDLPLEMVINLFRYLSHNEVIHLMNECCMFRKATLIHMRDSLFRLRKTVRKKKGDCTRKFKRTEDRGRRCYYVRCFLNLLHLYSEVNYLYIIVWRYCDDLEIWGILCHFIASILNDVTNDLSTIASKNWKLNDANLLKLFNVIDKITDSELSRVKIPFEIKVTDLLFHTYSSNYQFSVDIKDNDIVKFCFYFDLMHENLDDPMKLLLLGSLEQDKPQMLNFLRHYMYNRETSYRSNCLKKYSYDEIRVIIENRFCIKDSPFYKQELSSRISHTSEVIGNDIRREVFSRTSFYDVKMSGITFYVEARCGQHIPLVLCDDTIKKYQPFKVTDTSEGASSLEKFKLCITNIRQYDLIEELSCSVEDSTYQRKLNYYIQS